MAPLMEKNRHYSMEGNLSILQKSKEWNVVLYVNSGTVLKKPC